MNNIYRRFSGSLKGKPLGFELYNQAITKFAVSLRFSQFIKALVV
jgi:hypothetical protein